MKTAIIILGHGSRSAGADGAIQRIVAEVKKLVGYEIVEHAFLQYTTPQVSDVLAHCVREKADRVIIVPLFLQSGGHVTRDIPEMVEQAKRLHPNVEIVITDYVGTHPLIAKIVVDLVGKSDCGMRN